MGFSSFTIAVALLSGMPARAAMPQQAANATCPVATDGAPVSADKMAALLPQAVYFQGRTASLQLRNAGVAAFPPCAIVWAALVDTSGYATDVQERYQFYLVTEGPLEIGGAKLPAGAYGAGFVGDRFLVMDVGGHTVAEGAVASDAAMTRPRPLQIVRQGTGEMRIYLGRRWVALRPGV